MSNELFIHNEQELEKYKQIKPSKRNLNTQYYFKCSICGNISHKRLIKITYPFICFNCNLKKSMNKKEVKEKREQTNLRIRGCKYPLQSDEVKKKSSKTWKNHTKQQKEHMESEKQKTNLKIYKVKHVLQNKKCFNKMKKTMKDRHGKEYYLLTTKFKIAQRKKWDKNYGKNVHPTQTLEIKNKIKNTFRTKWGADNISQTKYWKNKIQESYKKHLAEDPNYFINLFKESHKKYSYDNKLFDSSWELCLYIWLKDHNVRFEYQPGYFKYTFNSETKYYYPDFKIYNTFVEIKGSHFFDLNTGKMINPYDRTQDEMYEAKHQCMLENNVHIILDCSTYINYVKNKYGKQFIKKCRYNK